MAEEKTSGCSGNCSSCSQSCGSRKEPQSLLEPTGEYNNIKHVIGVVSGKGGVGKSMVTSSLAVLMSKMGYKVGILDADITGPSIPKSFGINSKVYQNELGILPAETENGIKIMSINLLLEDKEAPVLWRGPVIAGAVKQFWHDVVWGDLDFLGYFIEAEECVSLYSPFLADQVELVLFLLDLLRSQSVNIFLL